MAASTSAIYGDDPVFPKHETMAPTPLSPYAVSKLAGEYYGKVFSDLYGIRTVFLRYFNVFGRASGCATSMCSAPGRTRTRSTRR